MRRNLIIGAACAIAGAGAYALRPRKRLVLLNGKITDAIPQVVGNWTAENADDLVQPSSDEVLAATLYSELVGRIYTQTSTQRRVMMLVAYGDTQSDLLQLHRPESCYPALGFQLLSSEVADLALTGGGKLPVRRVVAKAASRQENIVYWTRIGEYLPSSSGEQREVRLQTALRGYIPDGVLVRFSMIGENAASSFAEMGAFIPRLLAAIPAEKRRALLGSNLSAKIVA